MKIGHLLADRRLTDIFGAPARHAIGILWRVAERG